MKPNPNPKPGKRRVRNEAIGLYDMNADEIFHAKGYVVIDSSLGLVQDAPSPLADDRGQSPE